MVLSIIDPSCASHPSGQPPGGQRSGLPAVPNSMDLKKSSEAPGEPLHCVENHGDWHFTLKDWVKCWGKDLRYVQSLLVELGGFWARLPSYKRHWASKPVKTNWPVTGAARTLILEERCLGIWTKPKWCSCQGTTSSTSFPNWHHPGQGALAVKPQAAETGPLIKVNELPL